MARLRGRNAWAPLFATLVLLAGTLAPVQHAAGRSQQQEQMPAFGARVEMVRLHAAVLGDDGPVADLTAEDFVVIDNGVVHPVALALTPGETPIDVALVIDQSDSIRQGAPTVKRDARAFLDALGPEDCAFVLPFQHRIGPGVWGPSLAPTLLQTIDLTRLEGGTSIYDALIVGLSEVQRWNVPDVLAPRVVTEYQQPVIEGGVGIDFGNETDDAAAVEPDTPGFHPVDLPFRIFPSSFGCGGAITAQSERRKALVVLSDGVDTTSVHTFGELLGFLHETDVPIFPVGIGLPGSGMAPSVNRESREAGRIAENRLKALAEATGGKYVVGSGSETRLREAYDEVVTILRGSYLLGYYPQQSPAGVTAEEREVEVQVRRRGVEVFARTEYLRSNGDAHGARTALRRGAEAALAGQHEAALADARIAVRLRPDMWDGYFLEAAALWLDGRSDEAAVPLSQATFMAPGVASSHFLAWQLAVDRGDSGAAWNQLLLARIAGAEADAETLLMAERFPPPEGAEMLLRAPRIFIEGPRGDDPDAYARLETLVRAVSRAVSATPYFGLVRDPLAADYFLYIDAEDPDRRRPGALESRLELYNYVDQRLWREDLDVADLADTDAIETSVAATMNKLEAWLEEGR